MQRIRLHLITYLLVAVDAPAFRGNDTRVWVAPSTPLFPQVLRDDGFPLAKASFQPTVSRQVQLDRAEIAHESEHDMPTRTINHARHQEQSVLPEAAQKCPPVPALPDWPPAH